jgi:hypothetical protein
MAAFGSLAFATCLGLAVALPAAAQVKTAPAPAPAKPATAAGDKVVRLPTAVDGDVSYHFDATTSLPVSAADDHAMVTAAALTFLPKKKGEPLQWNMYYSLQFAKGVVPKFILVYDEGVNPLKLEVGDVAPRPDKGQWSASSQPATVDKATWDAMISPKTWYLQRKFMVSYADGTERTLHQLSVVTQQMRLELLEKVTGMKLLQPASASPAAPAQPAPAAPAAPAEPAKH